MACLVAEEWTTQENKRFEVALGLLDLDGPDWLELLTACLPTKTIDQVRDHYLDLVVDIDFIHSGFFMHYQYTDHCFASGSDKGKNVSGELGFSSSDHQDAELDIGAELTLSEFEEVMMILENEDGKEVAADAAAKADKRVEKEVGKKKANKAGECAPKKGVNWTEEEHRFVVVNWC